MRVFLTFLSAGQMGHMFHQCIAVIKMVALMYYPHTEGSNIVVYRVLVIKHHISHHILLLQLYYGFIYWVFIAINKLTFVSV